MVILLCFRPPSQNAARAGLTGVTDHLLPVVVVTIAPDGLHLPLHDHSQGTMNNIVLPRNVLSVWWLSSQSLARRAHTDGREVVAEASEQIAANHTAGSKALI